MFETLKEAWRESRALIPVQAEFIQLCPDEVERARLTRMFREVSSKVKCPHNESHILSFVVNMMKYCDAHPETHRDTKGVFVEAGCFKGGSTAKFSLVAKSLGREMVIYDSYEGMPRNQEDHDKSIFGYSIQNWFTEGSFQGTLEEVEHNVRTYGDISACSFVKGWFDRTLPSIEFDIAGAYIDVDLGSSTKTCIKHIYPRLLPCGFITSQDGDFPLVIEVFEDERFWEEEVGCAKPQVHGIRESKMLTVYKAD